jgi:hypothetical protein
MIFEGMFTKPVDWWKVCVYLGLLAIDIILSLKYILPMEIALKYKLAGIIFQAGMAVVLLNWLWNRSREMDR